MITQRKALILVLSIFLLCSCSRLNSKSKVVTFDYFIPDTTKTYSYTCKGYVIDEFSLEWEKSEIDNQYIRYWIDDYYGRGISTYQIQGDDLLDLGFHDPYADDSYTAEGADIVFKQTVPGTTWNNKYLVKYHKYTEEEESEIIASSSYEFVGFENIEVLGKTYNSAKILNGSITIWYERILELLNLQQ